MTFVLSNNLNLPTMERSHTGGLKRPPLPIDGNERVAWFDYAKGICILLVVMMHSTLGVGEAFNGEGWMHDIVAYAKPFRMPDFFMLSGLFLCLTIGRDWTTYLDRKVLHFAYFYLIWAVIQSVIKLAGKGLLTVEQFGSTMLDTLVTPFPTLWFIYVLPLFFVATKLLDNQPRVVVWGGAALAHAFAPHTGWFTFDYFMHYYVFFLSGYMFAPQVFKLARWAGEHVSLALVLFTIWAAANGYAAFAPDPLGLGMRLFELPGLGIVVGLIGASAIILIAAILAKYDMAWPIRHAGQNSIVLYVAFTIPMAITRVVLQKTGIVTDIGLVSLIVMTSAAVCPLVFFALTRRTPLRYLFVRPQALQAEIPAAARQ